MNWDALVTTLELASVTAMILTVISLPFELLGCVFEMALEICS